MSQDKHPDMVDPLGIWRTFQDANMELWAQGMAYMFKTEAFSQSMRAFLDSYLTTSAPFRKIFDQYMGFWLGNLNMPSREEMMKLEQRAVTTELRVEGLYNRLDHVVQLLQGQASQLVSLSNEQRSGMDHVVSQVHVLTTKDNQDSQALQDAQAKQLTQTNQRITDLEKRFDRFGEQLDQIVQLLQEPPAQTVEQESFPANEQSDVDERIQELDQKTEQMLEALQKIQSQMEAIHPSSQSPSQSPSQSSQSSATKSSSHPPSKSSSSASSSTGSTSSSSRSRRTRATKNQTGSGDKSSSSS
jgi:hypothetical protein